VPDLELTTEKDLGLGVLEEKDPNADPTSSSESEDEDVDGEGQLKPKDILSKLMGRDSKAEKVDIQVLGDVPAT
jgi:hypothetical protein